MTAKLRNEIRRLAAAFGHSFDGLKVAFTHPAFRTECFAAFIMLPLSFIIGHTAPEKALLAGSVLLVLIVELLNTGIEAAIDRISTERNPLSKFAKDVGSAAVLLSLANAGLVWLIVLAG